MFLKITSDSLCNREYLEVLGASTSRDDATKVGMFGSGAKFAPIALTRLKTPISIVSRDDGGPYKLTYAVANGGLNRMMFKYNDPNGTESITPSCYSLDAGKNWTEPIGVDENQSWKSVREFLANAQDADPDFTIQLVQNEPEFPSWNQDVTEVYIGLTEEVRKLHDNLDNYYASGDGWIESGTPSLGSTRMVHNDHSGRTFVKNFLVGVESSALGWSFWYNLKDGELVNEERTVKETWRVTREVTRCALSPGSAEFARHLISNMPHSEETRLIAWFGSQYWDPDNKTAKRRLQNAFRSVYGSDAVVSSDIFGVNDTAKRLGYTIVNFKNANDFMSEILPSASDRAGLKDREWRYLNNNELYAFERDPLDRAMEILSKEIPILSRLKVQVFDPLTPDQRNLNGKIEKNEISLNRNVLADGLGKTLRVLFHEINHASTSASDYTRDLQEGADAMVAKLLLQLHCG